MKKFIIWYGLGGGFNSKEYLAIQAVDESAADAEAYEYACNEYESYEGLHGLRDVSQIMEEDDIENEDEAYEAYCQERESWLTYGAMEYNEANVAKVKKSGNNFQDFK